MATINGTANDDALFIAAGKSNDTLLGLAGNDYLDALAGAGNNILRGGDGNDELFAFTNDQLFGDAGNDTLTSDGRGSNRLSGGDGNDTIYADRNDSVFGDAGDDVIFAGRGGNTLTGGLGKDVFTIADLPDTVNTIADFNQFQDTIRVSLTGVNQFTDLAIAPSGVDSIVSVKATGKQLAIVKNTPAATLNTNNVVIGINAPTNSGSNVSIYDFTNLPKLGTATSVDPTKVKDLFLGGFSGLFFQGTAANGNLKFVTNTDRGPNGDPVGQNRPFLLPDFQPEIVSFELNRTTGAIIITKRTGLFAKDGTTKLTGLPNLQASTNGLAYTDEIAVDQDFNPLTKNKDSLGGDVEGIVIDDNGNYWLVDEYRPAIYQFDVNGKLLDRFIPKGTAASPAGTANDFPAGTFGTEVLPEVYAQRRANRGFEAVALEGNKLYAFIQSAIDNPDDAGDNTSRNSRNLRILEFDIVSKTVTGEYLYLLDDISGAGTARTDKIGDAVSLGNRKFAVVERDDRSTSDSNKLIYQIDLANATNINNLTVTFPIGKTTIEQLTSAELITAGIKTVSKNLIVNASKAGYTGVEKLEGLALVGPNTLALINDNDFNVAAGSAVPERLGILELPDTFLPVSLKLKKNDVKDSFSVLSVSGGTKLKPTLSFTVNGSGANQVSELGVFMVDNADGSFDVKNADGTIKLGGALLPGTTEYAKEALNRSKLIFSAIANNPNGFSANGLNRLLSFNNNDKLRFYAINDKGTTTDLVLRDQSLISKVTFSSITTLNYKELSASESSISFNNLVINFKATNDSLLLGTGLQDKKEGEVLDLRGVDTTLFSQVKADFVLNREAAFNNFVGFYKIENEKGDIKKADGTIVSVGQSGYIQAAVGDFSRVAGIDLSVSDQSIQTSSGIFKAGSIFAPFIIINSNKDALLDSNPNNDPTVYFAFLGANTDGVDHVRLLGNNTFGFEDLGGGGDFDYNDFIVKVNLAPIA